MSEDKTPNNDFNEMPDSFNDLNAGTPEPDYTAPSVPDFETPQENLEAVNYEFKDVTEDSPSQNEIKIDETERNYNDPVTVRPVEFTQFDSYTPTNTDTNRNLELLMDIKLELTVELGRCQLPVKKVLELTRGSIIELDKVAGESVELYANGKHVANGEVVVIEDNFGLRITSITDPEERIKSL